MKSEKESRSCSSSRRRCRLQESDGVASSCGNWDSSEAIKIFLGSLSNDRCVLEVLLSSVFNGFNKSIRQVEGGGMLSISTCRYSLFSLRYLHSKTAMLYSVLNLHLCGGEDEFGQLG
jgi:hypothetical protein